MSFIKHFPTFLVGFSFLFLSSAAAETIEVCKGCSNTTIKEGLAAAKKGDVVLLKKGLYKENRLEVTEAITLQGENDAIIDGNGEPILFVLSDSVIVKDITFKNISTSYVEDKAAIRIVKSDYCSVINCKLLDTFFAIYIEKSDYAFIDGNYVKGDAKMEASSGNAVHAWYSNYVTIQNNILINHRDGIYLEFVEKSHISDNLSEGNIRYGLHFMFSHHDVYTNNTFKNNGSGVAVMFSDHVDMFNNTFELNWGDASYGLLLKDIKDSHLKGNLFKTNTIAIQADNAMRINIENNQFTENGWAMKIMGNCMENIISNNDFISNSFDISTNSAYNHNAFNHNYWNNYSGYDLDKDGIGDIPHRPVSLFSYTVTSNPPTLILMRSTFIEILNRAEKVIPVITPETLTDETPVMKRIND